MYSTFFPTGSPDQFCEHVFRSFDKDNSGRIDFKEFLLAINITSGGNPEQKLNWAFAMYDIDGNGTIEKGEMVEIIKVSIYIFLALIPQHLEQHFTSFKFDNLLSPCFGFHVSFYTIQ